MIKYLKSFSIYTSVGFLNAGIGFLLLPILTAYLSPEDYGVISLVNVYVQVLMPIVGLSTAGYLSVEYYNSNISKEQFASTFSSVRLIPLAGILVIAVIFLLGQKFLPNLMELPPLAYWMVVPITLFSLYFSNFSSFLIATKRARVFGLTSVGKLLFEISVTILLVVGIGMNWEGRIYSAFLAAFLFSLVSIYYYRKWRLLSWDIRREHIRLAILFGAPLIMHQIGKFVINQSDRLFLAKMVSIEEMGIYSVGYQVGTVVLILVTAFSNFFSPFLYERLAKNEDQGKREVVKMSYLFLAGTFVAVVLLTLVTPLLFQWFIDSRYGSATKYVFWVGLGYFFWGIYTIFSGYVFYHKKTKILGWLAVVNVTLNLAFNYLFIGKFGAIGAAYATCLSYFIVALIMIVVVGRRYPMPWGLKKIRN